MSHIQIDTKKAFKKWEPVLEKLGVNDPIKKQWLSEYAEYHQLIAQGSGLLNESSGNGLGLNTTGSVLGMGAVVSPGSPSIPGITGAAGSDIASSLLPTALKIAAATIGLDLVTTKPSPGPVIDLPFLDYKYEDSGAGAGIRTQMFTLNATGLAAIKTFLNAQMTANGVIAFQTGSLSKRMFFHLSSSTSNDLGAAYNPTVEPTGSKAGWVEFLGYSRIDKLPLFRVYQQVFTASTNNVVAYDVTKNTIGTTDTYASFFSAAKVEDTATGDFSNVASIAFGTVTGADIQNPSALDNNITGYTSNWELTAQTRDMEEDNNPGVIAPSYSVKRIMVGSAWVSSVVRLNEMEDIKAQTGIDVLQKSEGVLADQLAQKISREIVAKIQTLAEQNRATAPAGPAGYSIAGATMFDFEVNVYLAANAPGGETSHAVARQLVTKIEKASHYIAQEGRIGPAEYLVTSGNIAAVLKSIAGYTLAPISASITGPSRQQVYSSGKLGDIAIYVDPNMQFGDNRIFLGRKNKAEEPGILFIPYLMAQSITVVGEQTWSPRVMMRSRYAVAEVGFFPYKQFMSIYVKDVNGVVF